MIAFFFPIILGALIGFTFDDGDINKSDFVYIKKQLVGKVRTLKGMADVPVKP